MQDVTPRTSSPSTTNAAWRSNGSEQWIKEGKEPIKWARLSCRSFAANAVRLQLHALAYNLGNFMRTLAMPEAAEPWSLTSLREKLIKIGAKVVSHGRYVTFQLAEVAIPRHLFSPTSCTSSPDCERRPRQHEGFGDDVRKRATGEVRLDDGETAVCCQAGRGTPPPRRPIWPPAW